MVEMSQTIAQFDHVTFSYDHEPVLQDVTLQIRRGDFTCVVGPNGGGKSTLLKLLLGLLTPQSGRVELLGDLPVRTRSRVGYMPQYAHLDASFPVCVMDVVMMGRVRGWWPIGRFSNHDRRAATHALELVGMTDLRARRFGALSGGQRQRVLIARALACEPELLLLDEPTANLDPRMEDSFYRLLRELNQRLTIVLVSHDLGFVSHFVRDVVCVNRTVESHPTSELTGDVVNRMYGHSVHMVRHDHGHEHVGHSHSHSAPLPGGKEARP